MGRKAGNDVAEISAVDPTRKEGRKRRMSNGEDTWTSKKKRVSCRKKFS